MPPEPRELSLGVDSPAVLAGRELCLDTLELHPERAVLRYRVRPGLVAAELREQGRRGYAWAATLEDDLGTAYHGGFTVGGFSVDEPVTTGERSTDRPVPEQARFLTVAVYSPRLPGRLHGAAILVLHLALASGSTSDQLRAYREQRADGMRRLLRAVGGASDDADLAARAGVPYGNVAPWRRALAADGRIERHAAGWRVTH